jgi:hypothetical protein
LPPPPQPARINAEATPTLNKIRFISDKILLF